MQMLCAQTLQIKCMLQKAGPCVQHVHNSPEWSISKGRYAVLKGVGKGIFLDRPLPFKLYQSYRPLPRFFREFNSASQEIWSGPEVPAGMQTSSSVQKEKSFKC